MRSGGEKYFRETMSAERMTPAYMRRDTASLVNGVQSPSIALLSFSCTLALALLAWRSLKSLASWAFIWVSVMNITALPSLAQKLNLPPTPAQQTGKG